MSDSLLLIVRDRAAIQSLFYPLYQFICITFQHPEWTGATKTVGQLEYTKCMLGELNELITGCTKTSNPDNVCGLRFTNLLACQWRAYWYRDRSQAKLGAYVKARFYG